MLQCRECIVVITALAGETDRLVSWHESGMCDTPLTHKLSCSNSHCSFSLDSSSLLFNLLSFSSGL